MKPYGIGRKYNEDLQKNAVGHNRQVQSKITRIARRVGRHKDKNELRKLLSVLKYK